MKFTPKTLEENVNVSRTHPLVELFWLVGGLVLIAGVVFLTLGALTDWAVSKTPYHVETWLGKQALSRFPGHENAALQQRLTELLASLPTDSPLKQYDFRVFLAETDEVNAVALPGGNIVVYTGLLRQVKSENELAMVLAHELGHFAHRDHLRGLGRGLGLAVATTLLFGEDNAASSLVSKSLLSFQIKYSQSQEAAADAFGLELLNRRFGHVGGGTDFFARLAKQAGSRLPYLLASHPHPEARIEKLQALIEARHYRVEATLPLAEELQPEGETGSEQ